MGIYDTVWNIRGYSHRLQEIPDDRTRDAISQLRSLIKEMSDDGFPAARIGRFLNKDHTTILHHLKKLGITANGVKENRSGLSTDEILQKRKERQEWMLLRDNERAAHIREIRRIKEQRKSQRLALIQEKNDKWQAEKDRISAQRGKVLKLYKQGRTYGEILKQTGVSPSAVLNLLKHTDWWQKNKRKFNKRAVIQLTLDGVLLARFDSVTDAAKTVIGDARKRSNIIECCKGRQSTSHGFVWRYVD